MQGHVPDELVGAAAARIVRANRAIPSEHFRVQSEHLELISNQACGGPREIRSDVEAADIAPYAENPPIAKWKHDLGAHDWIDPFLVAAARREVGRIELQLEGLIAPAGVCIERDTARRPACAARRRPLGHTVHQTEIDQALFRCDVAVTETQPAT